MHENIENLLNKENWSYFVTKKFKNFFAKKCVSNIQYPIKTTIVCSFQLGQAD